MKQNLTKDIIQGMLPYLNNAQIEKLQEVLTYALTNYEVTENKNTENNSEQNFVELFLSAKRIEGCSEKSLKYYKATIEAMLNELQKDVKHIVTDDIRGYLTEYQEKNKSSKVTIDNIRRILSSFFSWLEDEDYILKSPVRRIHRVKTGTNIKETYSDEALELIYSDASGIWNGKIRTYRVNIRRLCFIIGANASAYYKENKSKFDFFNFTIIDWDQEIEKMKRLGL